ncbi:hypothetical protein BH11MYX4_BH11MYX4_01400 [soil metagenome]
MMTRSAVRFAAALAALLTFGVSAASAGCSGEGTLTEAADSAPPLDFGEGA